MRRRQRGFTLIELLIVMSIIAIILALAWPNLKALFGNAYETSALSTLNTYKSTMLNYSVKYSQVGFPSSFVVLGPPGGGGNYDSTAAGLVPRELGVAVPHKDKYTFILNSSGTAYTINANPDPGTKGARYFFMDDSGAITANANAPATANDRTVGQ
jgi:prepilin-type N-terminal cleavage/methylation domain-containing protein